MHIPIHGCRKRVTAVTRDEKIAKVVLLTLLNVMGKVSDAEWADQVRRLVGS